METGFRAPTKDAAIKYGKNILFENLDEDLRKVFQADTGTQLNWTMEPLLVQLIREMRALRSALVGEANGADTIRGSEGGLPAVAYADSGSDGVDAEADGGGSGDNEAAPDAPEGDERGGRASGKGSRKRSE